MGSYGDSHGGDGDDANLDSFRPIVPDSSSSAKVGRYVILGISWGGGRVLNTKLKMQLRDAFYFLERNEMELDTHFCN